MFGSQRQLARERLNALVDSAFAFAAPLLVFGQAGPMQSYSDLRLSILNLPAFALGFSVLIGFWWAHRAASMLQLRPDRISDYASMAITFVMMAFIFPTSFLAEALTHWASDGRLPGKGLVLQQTQNAYLLFGVGFASLSLLYALLYRRLLKPGLSSSLLRAAVRRGLLFWLCAVGAAVLSIILAGVVAPDRLIWLPVLPYLFLPIIFGATITEGLNKISTVCKFVPSISQSATD